MKKVFLGLLVAGVALAGSAFTNANKSITDNYLVQRVASQYTGADGSGTCVSTSPNLCKFKVEASGKTNIPAKSFYTPSDIATYKLNGWVTPVDLQGSKLYID